MDWWRVVKYAVAIYAVTFLAGAVVGMIAGAQARGGEMPAWYGAALGICNLTAIFIGFCRVGYVEWQRPWPMVTAVWVGLALLSLPNMIVGASLAFILRGVLVGGVAAALGAGLGSWLGQRSQVKSTT